MAGRGIRAFTALLGICLVCSVQAQELGTSTKAKTDRQRRADEKLFVDTRHTPGVAFDQYRSWAWIPMDETLGNPLLYEAPHVQGWIKRGVERALEAKGYQETSYGDADFSIAYTVTVRDVAVIRKHRFRGWSHGYNRSQVPRWKEISTVEEMPEGTVILDFVDLDLDHVVWIGRVSGLIQGKGSERGVSKALAALLERFPP